MAQKPSIPKGTRDFSPIEVAKRNYIFNIIRNAFELYGFQPIETPSFENYDTLMGKYGEEGDRLIFKILDSGDFYKRIKSEFGEFENFQNDILEIFTEVLDRTKDYKNDFPDKAEKIILKEIEAFWSTGFMNIDNKNSHYQKFHKDYNFLCDLVYIKVYKNYYYDNDNYIVRNLISNYYQSFILDQPIKKISEKALRYDLTVPFARYVVQHQNDIVLPFKRYQIQPVWRADRPQKGRYREFYQCDADVVGSKSLIQEVEFIQLYDEVFTKLGLTEVEIKVNNRKILSGIAEIIGAKDKLIDFTVALDKLDKIGAEGVTKEMLTKGISEDAIKKVQPLFHFTGTNQEKVAQLRTMLQTSEEGIKGVEELQFVVDSIEAIGLQSAILDIDVTLARGLNYYTGAIYEVVTNKVKMGSIGGGGRYDDLTSIFGLKDLSGIGISFGLDRIYLVLEELDLFNQLQLPKPSVLFLNYNTANVSNRIKALTALRKNGIAAEIYPDTASSNKQRQKQFKYVQKREIEFVVLDDEIGEELSLKNTKTGDIRKGDINTILNEINKR